MLGIERGPGLIPDVSIGLIVLSRRFVAQKCFCAKSSGNGRDFSYFSHFLSY